MSKKNIKASLKKLLVVTITVQSFSCYSVSTAWSAEYPSLLDAIKATTTPRTYTLDSNETSSRVLGNIGGANSVLTIDGGSGNYGINNTSTAADSRIFVNENQTVYLQNLGTYTTTTSSSIVDGIDIITGVTVGNSVNNFGRNDDRVGFLRSAGTSHIINSVFYNNRGKFGAALQNREQGTMSITGSVFVENSSPQGAVHSDGANKITQISDSIFYNNTATTQTSGDTDLKNRSASAIYNKPNITIDVISGSQFISNSTISTAANQQTGTIYNGGIIGKILNSVFYNNTNQRGAVLNNISGSTITTISNSTFVQNTSQGSGAAILNASGSTIGTIIDSLFISNTATSNGGAIYNGGNITSLAGTYTSNSAVNGGAIYNTGTLSDLSGNYSSNIASTNGGAIYNTGTITITSSNGDNTTFSGNTANGVSNALYNTGTVNMNAGTDSSIIFNDKIAGSNGTIAIGGEGIVAFNETVSGNSVTLNSGTLALGLADSLQGANVTVNGGTLDLRNGGVHNYRLGQSTSIGGTVGLAIDADLSGTTPAADMVTAAGAVSGTGNFVFSAGNINIMSSADGNIPFWVQVTDENLRNYAGLGSNANIHITGNEPESYFITYETSHDGVNAGFLKFEHDTLWNAIASSVEEKAYTMGGDETLANTPALGGSSLSINGNEGGYSITGDAGKGIEVGDTQILSLNGIGVDSTGNVTGEGFNNFNTAIANAANGTVNIYNTKFSNNTTDIDNDGVVNMSGVVILDTVEGTGTTNITKGSDGNASAVTVNNILEQNEINIEGGNTLTNDNATVTVNGVLGNAGTIAGAGTSTLVINGASSNSGTIEQGTITIDAATTVTNNGVITVNTALNNNGAIVGDDGVLNINATTENVGAISQGTLVTAASTTLTNTGDITVKTALTNSGTLANNNSLTLAGGDMTNAGTVNGNGTMYVTGKVTNEGTISQNDIQIASAGQLISDASDIRATAGITNDGVLELTGGDIASKILSTSGTMNVTGDVTNSNTYSIANAIDIKTGAKLTTYADAILSTTNNDGNLNLTGGIVSNDISGDGSTVIVGSIQNSANMAQCSVTVDSGKTLTNNSGATVTTTGTDTGFQNKGSVLNDGTISVVGGSNTGSITGNGIFANSGDFTNNNSINQDAITNNGTITTNAENLVATSSIANNGTLVYNAGGKTVSDITGDGSSNSHVELRTNSTFVIDNAIANTYVDLYNSTLRFSDSGDLSAATALNVHGGSMDLLDGSITSTNLGTVNLNAESTLAIDFDLSTLTSDSFSAVVNNNGGIFNVSRVNLLGTTTKDYIKVHLGDTTQLGQSNVTSKTIELPSIMTPIRRINGSIANGWLTYTGGTGTDISDFNPAVLATPVIAQAGMQVIMDNTFRYAYEHADWYTKFPAEKKSAMLNGNPSTISNGANADYPGELNLSDQYKGNLAIWFKSYATFEDMLLRSGPKTDVKSRGSLVGIDSNFQDWGRDWYGVTTGYIGYNGAHINYPGVNASMDGGMFGLTQTFYKNNFWTGVAANVGADFITTHTMYGRENSTIFATGLGAQTGYNIELGAGNFILQPIWLMNYRMINAFDYTNAAGVKIDPKPLHTIQLNPTLRLIGNVKGWQPYVSIGMVWNLMDKTDVVADSVKLPEMYIKPYMRYDVGVQKAIGNRFTGFIQVAGHNGGRDGIDVVGGLRWALGKGGANSEKVSENSHTESIADIQHAQELTAEKPVVATPKIQTGQEPIKAEKPVVDVRETDKKQQDSKIGKPVANTQRVAKKQKSAQAQKPVEKIYHIEKDQTDTKAEEAVVDAQKSWVEQKNVQSEESGQKGSENNDLAKAIAIGAILLLLVFLFTRKW